jgi:hypothetical protein
MTDLEQWTEAVARALCKADGWTSRDVAHAWKAYRSLARAAIRALAPLIIERCAEVARQQNIGMYDHSGAVAASVAIRALIQKEASDADSK